MPYRSDVAYVLAIIDSFLNLAQTARSGLNVVRGIYTLVIKRDESVITDDAPVFRTPPPPRERPGPSIPVYIDIPIVTPGGGRADAPNTGPGGSGIIDIFNRGNNPFQVTVRQHQRLLEQFRRETLVAAEAAQQVRSQPVWCVV